MGFNPRPNWPEPPIGWEPPRGWQPPPSWGPMPRGWNLWVDDLPQDSRQPQVVDRGTWSPGHIESDGAFPHQPLQMAVVNKPTNGMAIAALICAVLFAPVGVILGMMSLGQIKRTGEGGEGLAKAAVIVGGVIIAIPVVVLVLVLTGLVVWDNQTSEKTNIQTPQSTISSSVIVPAP